MVTSACVLLHLVVVHHVDSGGRYFPTALGLEVMLARSDFFLQAAAC